MDEPEKRKVILQEFFWSVMWNNQGNAYIYIDDGIIKERNY